jgi:hypothetical protein
MRPDENEKGDGHGNGGAGNAKNTVRITVNTTDSDEPRGRITYQRVIEIGYPDYAAHPNATYSILYERGPRPNPEGTLSKGGAVLIDEGMRFRVKRTGES